MVVGTSLTRVCLPLHCGVGGCFLGVPRLALFMERGGISVMFHGRNTRLISDRQCGHFLFTNHGDLGAGRDSEDSELRIYLQETCLTQRDDGDVALVEDVAERVGKGEVGVRT